MNDLEKFFKGLSEDDLRRLLADAKENNILNFFAGYDPEDIGAFTTNAQSDPIDIKFDLPKFQPPKIEVPEQEWRFNWHRPSFGMFDVQGQAPYMRPKQWRRRKFNSPYRKPIMRWHHPINPFILGSMIV